MAALDGKTLAQLARIAQKEQLAGARGSWKDFLQSKGLKLHDPAKVDAPELREFISSLMHPAPEQQQQQAQQPAAPEGPGPDEATYSRNTLIIARSIAWLQRLDKEKRLLATSAPPPLRRVKAKRRGSSSSSTATDAPTLEPSTAAPAAAAPGEPAPVDVWQLVRDTRAHVQFHSKYLALPSYRPGWARTKRRTLRWPRGGAPAAAAGGQRRRGAGTTPAAAAAAAGEEGARWSLARPRLLALDCEMVKTQEGRSLVNLSVVDDQGHLVYTTMVKPRYPVLDCRSDITGLSTWDLEGVTTTRSEARRKVKSLLLESWRACGVPTILVGHALNHDLEALRLDHQPCIDTALIFCYQSLPDCMPSLSDLYRVVLGREMTVRADTGRHDSQEDAWASMQLVLHELGRAQRTGPLPPPSTRVDRSELSKLLVHSIPPGTTEQELLDLFAPFVVAAAAPAQQPNGSSAAHADSDDSEDDGSDSDGDDGSDSGDANGTPGAGGQAGGGTPRAAGRLTQAPVLLGGGLQNEGKRAVLVFKHAGEANEAFRALQGKVSKDNTGLRQKEVALPCGRGKVKVRMSGAHNGLRFGPTKPAPATAAAAQGKGTKRRRQQQQQKGHGRPAKVARAGA